MPGRLRVSPLSISPLASAASDLAPAFKGWPFQQLSNPQSPIESNILVRDGDDGPPGRHVNGQIYSTGACLEMYEKVTWSSDTRPPGKRGSGASGSYMPTGVNLTVWVFGNRGTVAWGEGGAAGSRQIKLGAFRIGLRALKILRPLLVERRLVVVVVAVLLSGLDAIRDYLLHVCTPLLLSLSISDGASGEVHEGLVFIFLELDNVKEVEKVGRLVKDHDFGVLEKHTDEDTVHLLASGELA
ncbi:hypothetical protein GGR58DRAFT_509003 [Xylaria digitata]|nr:hypothetical protein GGR58DRAFT_509003 [Xylaria digitata]